MRYTLVNTIEDIICKDEDDICENHLSIDFENENGIYIECFISLSISEKYVDQKDYDLPNYYEFELNSIDFEELNVRDFEDEEIKLTEEEKQYLEEEVYKFIKSIIES